MGQFRLRKKFRKDGDKDGDKAGGGKSPQYSGIEPEDDDDDFMFRPKTFVNQPRDQLVEDADDRTNVEFNAALNESIIVKVHDKPKLPKVGATLGKCKITKQIGQGSSCLVFTALHQALQINVAIKVFLPDDSAGQTSLRRFRDQFKVEAQTLAKLNDPNIVRVLDFEDTTLPYMILEYVDGVSLMDKIKRKGALPPEEASRMIISVCNGLGTAHKNGVIHRDIKPENILLTKEGVIKLADLGIAKITSGIPDEDKRTDRGILCGTPAYVAPEQALNANSANELSDVYSLGASFYHMVTGRYPFDATRIEEMISKHISQAVVPPHVLRPNVPVEISEVIVTMMSKDPSKRPALSEVKKSLQRYLAQTERESAEIKAINSSDGTGTISFLRETIAKAFNKKKSDS